MGKKVMELYLKLAKESVLLRVEEHKSCFEKKKKKRDQNVYVFTFL